jgi:queuosine precursor transporter
LRILAYFTTFAQLFDPMSKRVLEHHVKNKIMKKQVSVAFMVCGLLFTVCLLVANIVEQKLIRIGPIEATAGLLIFPFSYILNDVIAEVWGYSKARLIIWCGFAMNFLAVAIFQLSIYAPASANFTHQDEFQLVLGNTLRLVLASFVAFLCGSFLNAYVMSKMKVWQKGKMFSIRAVASTIVGEGADSLVFFSLAFYGIIPTNDLLLLIATQMGMKTGYEILILPVTNYVVRKVKKLEETDVYDKHISYNPFSVK